MLKKRYSTAGRIDSVIDLEKLRSGPKSCLGRDAAQFLRLTYLTEDFHAMLRSLSRRFGRDRSQNGDSPGLVLAEGVKGQGKSHALNLTYHLFANPEPARAWMAGSSPAVDAIPGHALHRYACGHRGAFRLHLGHA